MLHIRITYVPLTWMCMFHMNFTYMFLHVRPLKICIRTPASIPIEGKPSGFWGSAKVWQSYFFCVRLHHANTTLAANEFLYLPRTASFRHTQDGARRMQAQTNEKYTLARLFWAQTVKPNWNHCGAHPAPQKKSTKTLRYMMPLVNINIPHFHFYPTYAKRTLQIWKPKKKMTCPAMPVTNLYQWRWDRGHICACLRVTFAPTSPAFLRIIQHFSV